MHCKDVNALWMAHSEGALSDEMEGAISSHITSCAACSKMQARWSRLEYRLETLVEETVEPPPFLLTRIMARIAETQPSPLARVLGWLSAPRLVAVSVTALAFFAGILTHQVALIPGAMQGDAVQTVVLEYEAPRAGEVGLVGDFNDWGRKAVPMQARNVDGRWLFEVELEPGRYQYAFVVDGKKWLPDPHATGIIPDGFGGMNSVLNVWDNDGPKSL